MRPIVSSKAEPEKTGEQNIMWLLEDSYLDTREITNLNAPRSKIPSQFIGSLPPCLATRPLLDLASARSYHTRALPRLLLDETSQLIETCIVSLIRDETDAGPRRNHLIIQGIAFYQLIS